MADYRVYVSKCIHISKKVAGITNLVEVVVLANELLQLRLDIDNLALRELELDNGNTGLLQVLEETNLGGLEEEQTLALGVGTTGSSSDTVNVVTGVIRGIELDDPVDGGDIETTSSNVGTDQSTLLGVTELEESVGALLLLLLSVQLQNGEINVVQQLGVVLNAVTAGEENNDLLLQVALEEREQQQEALVSLTDNITLLQTLDGTVLLAVVDVDVQRTGAQRDTGQVLDLGGLGSGEQHSLTLLRGKNLDDLAHLVLETDFENTVSLVNNEGLQVLKDETLGVLKVIEQTTGGCDDQVDTLGELVGFGATVGTTNDDTVGLGVVSHELSCDTEDLEGKLTGGRDNEDTGSVSGLESIVKVSDILDFRDGQIYLKADSISMAGMRKLKVFPDPVFAAPSTSRPARRGGIVRC